MLIAEQELQPAFMFMVGVAMPFSFARRLEKGAGRGQDLAARSINFLSSTVTTLFGVWTGMLMRRADTHAHRMMVLAGAAFAAFLSGRVL